MPSQLLPIYQWLHANSCTLALDVRLRIAVRINQRVLNKSRKEHNKTDQEYAYKLLLICYVPKNMSYGEAIGE